MAWQLPRKDDRLALITPSRGEVSISWAVAYSQVTLNSPKANVNQYTDTGYGVDHARNACVENALNDGCTYLAFLDDDVFPFLYDWENDRRHFWPQMFADLLSHEYPIASGMYFGKRGEWCVYAITEETAKTGKLEAFKGHPKEFKGYTFMVDAVGFGAVIIDARVFERVKFPWFEMKTVGERGKPKSDTGEDIDFCLKARNQGGFKVLVDARFICKHERRMYDLGNFDMDDQVRMS